MKISEALNRLRKEQVLKGHAECTVKSYTACVEKWLRQVAKNGPVTTESIRDYLYNMSESENKNTTVNLNMDAIRFFCKDVLHDSNIMRDIKHLKIPKQLARVHSKEQIFEMIEKTINPKHKFLIMVSYGCGLRINEAVNLRACDLNWDRMRLTVRTAKGGRDREINLSDNMYVAYNAFALRCGQLEYVFPGRFAGPLSKRSAEKIYQAACNRCGVPPTGFHTLRHSFITHMIEAGVAIEAVRQIVGHKSIKTTQGYTHISNNYLGHIKSPVSEMSVKKLYEV